MKIWYICEVCGNRFDTAEEALKCEARKPAIYPIGCIYGDHREGAMYQNITFAFANNRVHEHFNHSSSWACRDNWAGDSLDEETCSSGGSSHLTKYDSYLDINHPTFKRMVKYLQSKEIPVTVWDGEKPVPYAEYMEMRTNEKLD